MTHTDSIARHIGTALAVLAIYLLTVLSPMHQARASQLAFEAVGYSTIAPGWALCSQAGDIDQDGQVSLAKCPAAGAGKPLAIAPGLNPVVLEARTPLTVADLPWQGPANLPDAEAPPGGPRGPPSRA
ncbi:hypothetical protein [Devosia aquimaris]|uniref:hypothetical protein n=1 Tax=Devosia aquimaris TaxID=2866214 RepID=UPI001CD0CA15|nr:hypothetical protein [Devosia sp. CJK-A8-3]